MKLQRQLSNGNYADATEYADIYLDRAVAWSTECHEFNPSFFQVAFSRGEIIRQLQAGRNVSTGSDWYNQIRIEPAPLPKPQPDTRPLKTCRGCGQTGYAHDYPFSTMGGSICDDCL